MAKKQGEQQAKENKESTEALEPVKDKASSSGKTKNTDASTSRKSSKAAAGKKQTQKTAGDTEAARPAASEPKKKSETKADVPEIKKQKKQTKKAKANKETASTQSNGSEPETSKKQAEGVKVTQGGDAHEQKPGKMTTAKKNAEPVWTDSAAEDVAEPTAAKRGRNALPLVGMAVFCVIALLIAPFAGNASSGVPSSAVFSSSSQTVASSSVLTVSSLAASSQEEPATPNWGELITFSEEDIQRLDSMLAGWAAYAEEEEPLGHQVAVYFKDIDSGLEYIYNGGQTFYMASLNKAPYALYLYHLVDIGQITLGDTFYVTYGGVNGGAEESGRIQSDPTLPRDYTLEELIYYLLRYSDTGAMRILLQHFPATGFAEFAGQAIGIPDTTRLQALLSGRIDAVDAGLYLDALFDYMESGAHGAELKEHMLNASYKMIRSEHPVAHKYGWDENAYHDMAVVYAEHPYMLAILTGKSNGSGAEYGMFGTIAGVFEEIMQEKWTAAKQEY